MRLWCPEPGDQFSLRLPGNRWLAFLSESMIMQAWFQSLRAPLICMQPLSLLAPRKAEVHIIVIPSALLWIFQRDATHLGENSDQYRWINQCFGISQRKPALSSKRGELVRRTHMGYAALSSTSPGAAVHASGIDVFIDSTVLICGERGEFNWETRP